ncbi:hypothetical protein D3C87_145840 [compost metagenome]
MTKLKDRVLEYYEKNETKVDVFFFLAGFFFDVFTLTDVDDLLGVTQQVVYLLILGAILYFDFLSAHGFVQIPKKIEKVWEYRQPALHFLMGSLLSLYSLFFLKSASLFSSIVFVLLLVVLMIANELKSIRKSGINIKIALYVICVFSFFSITVPVLLGFVGVVPFILSLGLTGAVLYGVFHLLLKKVQDIKLLVKTLLGPGAVVLVLFLVFYVVGWIPPVPLSIQSMGIYHNIEKSEGQYILYHQNSSWSLFGNQGDKDFIAEPGDRIYFFAEIFSPARFSDSVILHWYYKDPRVGWQSTDRIPMAISGGRKNGYRGFATKQNYSEGRWRISVETTDGREIGRIYFNVTKVSESSPDRSFQQEVF